MWFKLCEMAWFTILLTFIKIKNHLNHFGSTFVFFNTSILHSFPQIYSNLSLYKEIVFSNILLRLYFNIICKNFVKIFQKFEAGYIQICTFLKHSTPKWVTIMCFHQVPFFQNYSKGEMLACITKGRSLWTSLNRAWNGNVPKLLTFIGSNKNEQ